MGTAAGHARSPKRSPTKSPKSPTQDWGRGLLEGQREEGQREAPAPAPGAAPPLPEPPAAQAEAPAVVSAQVGVFDRSQLPPSLRNSALAHGALPAETNGELPLRVKPPADPPPPSPMRPPPDLSPMTLSPKQGSPVASPVIAAQASTPPRIAKDYAEEEVEDFIETVEVS